MKKKIAHISTVHIRTDTRILYKEVQTLSKVYNTILIVADGKGDSSESFAKIIDLGKPKNRVSRILFFGWKAMYMVKKQNIYCVHIHDPELIMIAFVLKLCGYKVVYDIHELVYEDIRTKNWITSKTLKYYLAGFYKALEGLAFKYFDGIILAEDGYKDFYEMHYPKYISKITYIRNYPIKSMFNLSNKDNIKVDVEENSIIYIGAISENRGVVELVEAMDFLDDTFKLYIIGRWSDSLLLEKCKKLLGWSKVHILGYLKPDQIGEYIQKSKIGMCTLHRLENFAYTTPVKSFEYLINGLPIVMTDFPFWKDFYNGTAVFVDPKQPKEIAKVIVKLINDKTVYNQLSSNGIKLALNNCWENEEQKLLNLYKKLV